MAKRSAVVVTGAGSGIGAAISRWMVNEGHFIFLLGRKIEKLQTLAQELEGRSQAVVCDLASSESIDKAILAIAQSGLEIETLVNNAAIYIKNKPQSAAVETWRRTFATNILGTVELTEKLLPALQENAARGLPVSIVNVASTLGLRPIVETSGYSASKAAMINWTSALALELAPKIRVNCVCPGIVDTPIHPFHSLPPEEKAKTLEAMKSAQPMQRIGKPEDVAEAVGFLASTRSSWTTGSILTVDGGINLI